MGITSVMLPDETILNGIDGLKSVAVIGCRGCANSSIAYTRKLPIYRIEVDADTEEITRFPAALPVELDRLKGLIESKGISVKTEMLLSPCVIARAPDVPLPYGTEADDQALVDRCAGVEAVITLCCPGGAMGLKNRFEKTGAKFVPGMKPLGVFCRRTIVDKEKGLEYIDWDRAQRILLFEN